MPRQIIAPLAIAFALLPLKAMAHPKIGASLVNAAVETLFIGAPIPNLDGGPLTITPQYGILKTKLVNKSSVPEGALKANYSGEVNGNSAGLGLTFPSNGDLSFFIYATGAQQSGDFQIAYDAAPTVRYTD
ncbi:MAG TPA: hypothetical protein VM432_09335, partial [Bdellovibrionales bacterium]|nr:hypothetical protein [Bdellovibrionales bacterium]